jgi:cytidylate kinase
MASPIVDIQGYLAAAGYREVHPRVPGEAVPIRPFVTISRQTGAGGHTLAETLLRAMGEEYRDPVFQGWQVFDRALCERLTEDPKLHVSMRSLLTEEYRSQIEDVIFSLLGRETPQDVVLKKLFETIRSLAILGHAIIVGRAGACVTKGIPGGVHVRLVASEPTRVRRMRQLFGTSELEAREAVKTQDRARAALVRTQFHRDVDDPLLYDAVWNTDAVAFDTIARSIVAMITQRTERPSVPQRRSMADAGADRGGSRR